MDDHTGVCPVRHRGDVPTTGGLVAVVATAALSLRRGGGATLGAPHPVCQCGPCPACPHGVPPSAWRPAVGGTDGVKSQAMELNRSDSCSSQPSLPLSSAHTTLTASPLGYDGIIGCFLVIGCSAAVEVCREPQPRTPASARRLVWAGCWGMLCTAVGFGCHKKIGPHRIKSRVVPHHLRCCPHRSWVLGLHPYVAHCPRQRAAAAFFFVSLLFSAHNGFVVTPLPLWGEAYTPHLVAGGLLHVNHPHCCSCASQSGTSGGSPQS